MTLRSFIPVALTVALAGCSVVALNPMSPNPALQATNTSVSEASLPFKTVAVDPEGQGAFFKAGTSETAVLHSRAELDAFMARHARAVQPEYAPPSGPASPTPPSGIPYGTPTPAFNPAPLPVGLMHFDFDRYMAIAFFDGQVTVASTSRVVAVQDQGDKLAVSTRRWDPPPNPAAIPDQNGRLHVIALARTDKPVTFLPTDVVDGASKTGGGYGVGGNPTMRPQWPAVRNPEITREVVEKIARGWVSGSSDIASFDLQLAPLSSARMIGADSTWFTPDSLVWVARVKGDIAVPGSYGPSPGVAVGGPPTVGETIIIVSPEDGNVVSAGTFGEIRQPQGFEFHLKPEGPLLRLGDTLRFDVKGPQVEGSLTLTLRSGSATPVVHTVSFKDLANFALVLDPAHVPLLTGAAVQPLTIEFKYGAGKEQNVTGTSEVHIVRDANVQAPPPMRGMGPGTLAEYHPQAGETAADAFVRDIAATDWQGTGLAFSSRTSTVADVKPKGNWAVDLAPTTPVRVYDVRGTFPTFLVPALTSSTNADEAMSPSRLEVAVTESLPIRVVSLQAFPR